MSDAVIAIGVLALLGAALVSGVFFAFSSFVMKALGRMPSAEGIAAMQSINVVVINRSFLGVFMGTMILSLMATGLAIVTWGSPAAPWFLAGALSYLFGTFLVTALGNVPLNDRLAAIEAGSSEAIAVWQCYLSRWTSLNTLRTAFAAMSALAFTVALIRGA